MNTKKKAELFSRLLSSSFSLRRLSGAAPQPIFPPPGGFRQDPFPPPTPPPPIHTSYQGDWRRDLNAFTGPANPYPPAPYPPPSGATVEQFDGFLADGKAKEASGILSELEKQGIVVDVDRCLRLLELCADDGAADEARQVHAFVSRTAGPLGVRSHNRILKAYFRCGAVDDARRLFDEMPERNITSWETTMLGLADNGLGEDAVDLFYAFLSKNLTPDSGLFLAVFRVCSALGAVDEGVLHLESMEKNHGIPPGIEHYAGIIRMLCENGYLAEALEFIQQRNSIREEVIIWETLMNSARAQGDTELGDRCAGIVEILEPGRLTETAKVGLLPVPPPDAAAERRRKAKQLEVRSRVHEYRAGDTSHPEKDKIYGLIRGLACTLREGGYVPDTRFVLHDVEVESKEEALLAHSERLATAYGLISSSARSPIRIIKNLRICGDCHSYMKVLSKATGRELIIRDAKRFHHFKDGVCSCRDYW